MKWIIISYISVALLFVALVLISNRAEKLSPDNKFRKWWERNVGFFKDMHGRW